MKISGFSLIEVLLSLMLLSLGMSFTYRCLVQSSQLYSISKQRTELSLLAASIAESISINDLTVGIKTHWDNELKAKHKDAHLSISNQDSKTRIVIETPNPQMKRIQYEIVSG